MAELGKVRDRFVGLVSQLDLCLSNWEATVSTAESDEELDAHMPELRQDVQRLHDEMELCAKGLGKAEIAALKNYYRAQTTKFWAQGEIINRCLTKPQGYHGDFMTMALMYENQYSGDTNLGKCLHKYVTDDPSSASVRGRRAHLAARLMELGRAQPISILSVASGPAAEIRDALDAGARFSKIALLDQDHEALLHAESRIREVLPAETELVLLNISIFDLIIQGDHETASHGPFDLVYSAGLYDYLPDEYALQLSNYLFTLVKDAGTLEIGNFTRFPIGFFADFTTGWRLILRGPMAMMKLVPNSTSVDFFPVGDQSFVRIARELPAQTGKTQARASGARPQAQARLR